MAYANPNLLTDAGSNFEAGVHNWVEPSNCTLTVVTGQYLVGNRSLRFTASAAGSVAASSAFVAGVTPGAEYVARVPVRLSVPSAGRTLTARMSFFTDAGGALSFKDSTITVSGTGTGWSTDNYVCVSLRAPADATRVRITFTASGLAAGEYVNVDDVYLGIAPARAGEVIDYNTRSIESDTSGWVADNATLSRVYGTLATGAGYYVLGATSVAAGLMDIRNTSLYPVTADELYVAYTAVQATAPMEVICNISWYDSAVGFLGNTEQSFTVDGTVQRIAVSGRAPAGTATAKVWIRPTATAAGQSLYIDDLSLAIPAQYPGNLLTFEEYSTESTLPAWSLTNASVTRRFFTSAITEGYFALRVAPDVPGMVAGQLDRLVPVTPGETYQARGVFYRFNSDTAQSVASAARVRIDWYDSAGNLVQADNPDQFYSTETANQYYGTINSETRTCPADATHARVGFELDSTSPLVTAWYVDNISLAPAQAEYLLTTHDTTGSVSLQINTVVADATTVTIQRVDENGRKTSLRGYGVSYDNAPYTPAPILVEDYEVPLGTRVWYSVTWGGTTYRLFTQSVDGPVLADGDYVWFKSPGIPALNTTVMMESPPSWSRAARSASYDIVGRKNAISISDVRAGRTSSISILIWDPAANALFDSLLDSGMVALIQAMPGYGIEGNLYVSIGNATCDQLSEDAREDGWRWTLEIAERDRPVGGMQGSAGATWQSIYDSYADWDSVFDTHDAWTDVLIKE